MTTVTGPLRDPNQAPTIAAHNAETVRNLSEGLIEAQKERIAELEAEIESLLDQIKQVASDNHALEAEIAALRAVAVAVEWVDLVGGAICPKCNADEALGHTSDCPYADLYAAGYLPVEETRP